MSVLHRCVVFGLPLGLAVALYGIDGAAADEPEADPDATAVEPGEPGVASEPQALRLPDPVAEPAPSPAPAPVVAADPDVGFRFGSYGRVAAATDLRGGRPEPVAVVAHGPRVVEPSYLELELQYGFRARSGVLMRTVTTVAYDDQLFHDTGTFAAGPAIRNLYAEARWHGGSNVWVGSRMARGDDLYLFDYWPLDDLNTVGAGGELTLGDDDKYDRTWFDVAAHVGGTRAIEIDGATVGGALDQLVTRYPQLAPRLRDAHGAPYPFVTFYLNDEDVRLVGGSDTTVADGDDVTIVPAVAGG